MLKKINYVLDRKQKINLGILLIIIFIGAFVELLGVSAVMPLINVAMQPETIHEKWYFILISKYTRADLVPSPQAPVTASEKVAG